MIERIRITGIKLIAVRPDGAASILLIRLMREFKPEKIRSDKVCLESHDSRVVAADLAGIGVSPAISVFLGHPFEYFVAVQLTSNPFC